MNDHLQLTDQEFENQFENLSLKPSLFNHEAHLRLAWIHIHKYGEKKAIENICNQIKQFATHHGDSEKFNTTVTVAAVKAVKHFYSKSTSTSFKNFIQEFPRLKTNFKDLMAAHYKMDIYNSEKAKKEYLDPDLLLFD